MMGGGAAFDCIMVCGFIACCLGLNLVIGPFVIGDAAYNNYKHRGESSRQKDLKTPILFTIPLIGPVIAFFSVVRE